jgi:hypothetical protein
MDDQKHDRMLARAAERAAARGHATAKPDRISPNAKGQKRGEKAKGRDVAGIQRALRETRKGARPK